MRSGATASIIAVAIGLASLQALASAAPAGERVEVAKTVTVDVKDNFFSPKSLKVRSGTSVKFRWAGRNPHSVIAKRAPAGAAKFRSDTMTSGTYSKKLKKKGSYHIECGVHGASMFVDIKAT